MKKHFLILFLIIFSFSNSFGQSKKEQIEQLNYRVDSLVRILGSERNSIKQQIVDLNNSITKLKAQALIDNNSLKIKDEEIVKAASEKAQLSIDLKEKKDSLNLVLADLVKLKPPVKVVPVIPVVDNKGPIKGVAIGTQVWMTKNLDVAKFRNGDPIPEAKTDEEWKKAYENEQPAWCYYENDRTNGAKYGKLYNWYAVNDPRGLAPKGYHVPSDEEWTVLTDYLGGEEKAGAKMKSKTGWFKDGNGTNSSGFSGLPGGYRYYDGAFSFIGYYGYWWSSSEYATFSAWYRYLHYYYGNVNRYDSLKQDAFSVRCLRD